MLRANSSHPFCQSDKIKIMNENIMKNKILYALLLFVLICGMFSTCNAEPKQTTVSALFLLNQTAASSHADALKTMLAKVLTEFEAPGASMAIKFQDGSVFQHAAGVADTTNGEPLTIEDYFRIGSATKTFTAVATLLLYQDDLLDLDDTVESILPDLTEFNSMHGKGITVRMLLNHTSGLDDYVHLPDNNQFIDAFIADPEKTWSPEEMVLTAVTHGLISIPGSTFHYANTNYILLGLIIEKRSNMDFEAFIAGRLFQPLKLQHTSVPVTTGFPGKYAHGYLERDGDGVLYDYSIQSPTAVWAAGNLISTVPDLLIWLESLMEGGLLGSEIKNEQFNFSLDEAGNGYGLGVAAMGYALGHNGTVLGYQTWMFRYQNIYFVIYSNCFYGTKENLAQVIFERAQKIIFPE